MTRLLGAIYKRNQAWNNRPKCGFKNACWLNISCLKYLLPKIDAK